MKLRSALFAASLLGCATSPAPAPRTSLTAAAEPRVEAPPAPEAEERVEEARPTVSIHGLTGSLTRNEAQRALTPRTSAFAQCFVSRSDSLRELGGEVRLHIRVAPDGRVAEVFPEDSTVGDRDVERCLTEVALDTRFPRPRGGEAILRWPIGMDPAELSDHPTTWDPSHIAHVIDTRGDDVVAQCRPRAGRIQVTAYVSRQGRVLSAGAAVDGAESNEALDCVVEQVRDWQMPRARRVAKVTFELPS